MAYQPKPNEGSMGANKKKTKDTQPDATGKFMHDGHLHYFSAWRQQDTGTGIWYRISVKDADEYAQVDTTTGEPQSDDPAF
jgi:hypothetical protein